MDRTDKLILSGNYYVMAINHIELDLPSYYKGISTVIIIQSDRFDCGKTGLRYHLPKSTHKRLDIFGGEKNQFL